MKISGLLFISIRYIYTSGGRHFSSVMSIISIVGTCLSAAILICIMSIMNGFEDELKSRMLGPGAHLDIFINQQSEAFGKSLLSSLRKDKGVVRADLVLEGDALISFEGEFLSATVRGIKSDFKFLENVISPRLKDGSIRSFLNTEYIGLVKFELGNQKILSVVPMIGRVSRIIKPDIIGNQIDGLRIGLYHQSKEKNNKRNVLHDV